jgi:hypothetical protein
MRSSRKSPTQLRVRFPSGEQTYGTKMRSVIKLASRSGIAAVVDQQFEIAAQIANSGRRRKNCGRRSSVGSHIAEGRDP